MGTRTDMIYDMDGFRDRIDTWVRFRILIYLMALLMIDSSILRAWLRFCLSPTFIETFTRIELPGMVSLI